MASGDLQATLKRIDEDEEFRRGVIDKLGKDADQLGQIRATLKLNFGKPSEDFDGGRIAPIADTGTSTHRMLVDVLVWLLGPAGVGGIEYAQRI